MRGALWCLIGFVWLVGAPRTWGKSRAQFDGVDTQGVEITCECFKIILQDVQVGDGPGVFTGTEVLKLALANRGTTTCEINPYQFRVVTPGGEQREALFAIDEKEIAALRF